MRELEELPAAYKEIESSNEKLTIRQFTPAERVTPLRAAGIGRPIGEIRMNLMVEQDRRRVR